MEYSTIFCTDFLHKIRKFHYSRFCHTNIQQIAGFLLWFKKIFFPFAIPLLLVSSTNRLSVAKFVPGKPLNLEKFVIYAMDLWWYFSRKAFQHCFVALFNSLTSSPQNYSIYDIKNQRYVYDIYCCTYRYWYQKLNDPKKIIMVCKGSNELL